MSGHLAARIPCPPKKKINLEFVISVHPLVIQRTGCKSIYPL